MRHNTFFSAAIVLCMIAFFTMGWKSFSPHKPGPVNILIVGFPQGMGLAGLFAGKV